MRGRRQTPSVQLDDGALGGGQVDGLDPGRQGFLQVLQDVAAEAVRRGVVHELFEGLQLDQHQHVLQEVALDEGRQLRRLQKLDGGREGGREGGGRDESQPGGLSEGQTTNVIIDQSI